MSLLLASKTHKKWRKNCKNQTMLEKRKYENWISRSKDWYMFAKNSDLHWIVGRANILSKYIMYIFFNFGRAFCGLFVSYFQKLQLLVVKKFWTKFCCIVLLYLWAQKECLRFLKSYFKLEVLIFLSFVVSFLIDIFN